MWTLHHGLFPLQDDIEAYKTQNTYLNSEVYQLTKVWRQSAEQEKSLMIKVGDSLGTINIITFISSIKFLSNI